EPNMKAMIDFDTQLLPDNITLPLLWFGLVINFFGVFVPFPSAFLGAVFGYMTLWTVYQLFKLATGKEGMGFGDFKMLAMMGAWLGAASLPLIIVLSSFAGAVIGGALILAGRDRSVPLKFGPFLAIAGFIALIWGNDLINLYLRVTLGSG
ncbi:MAG: prepilin peptidase, partial [Pseudomonadales bacterium]|nr:prepilin peptidase [Pseudomonadales bacterium]